MQKIEVNSRNISYVLYQHFLLTVVLRTGERFIYRLLEAKTFNDFLEAIDKDKFYKTKVNQEEEKRKAKIKDIENQMKMLQEELDKLYEE